MREGIHPEYFPQAVVHCMCGNEFHTGSTQPELKTEVCSQCHPFFTGQEHLVDTAGQVERFRKKQDNAAAKAAAKKSGRA